LKEKLKIKNGFVNFGLIVVFCLSMLAIPAIGETSLLDGLHKVASNDCGNGNAQPNLFMGSSLTYPVTAIAETVVADAFVGAEFSGTAGPVTKPNYPWRHDTNELGTNDFRSTKENVISAYLSDPKTEGLVLQSNGTQHVRCWVQGDVTRMLISEYNNPGSERFYRSHAAVEDKPLKAGGKISGSIRLTVY
jgi:hypothetical protein